MKETDLASDKIIRVTNELTAKVNVNSTPSGKWRGSYTFYEQPDTRQKRENKFGLGSPLGPTIKSLTYETREEAKHAVEETIVGNQHLKQQVIQMYDRCFPDHDVSVKLFLLRFWEEITSQSSCSQNVLKKYFFNHETLVEVLCNFSIKGCTANSLHCLTQDLMRDGYRDDQIINMLRYLKFIFRIAKDFRLYTQNPVVDTLSEYNEYQSLMRELRKALVLRSLSKEENVRLLHILRKYMETEPGLAIGCMIRWQTGMLSREVAPLKWKDIVVIESVNIMQILVYQEFPTNGTEVREMTYDDLYRVVPLCLMLREALEEYREKMRVKYCDLSDEAFGNLPVVSCSAKPQQHITPEALTRFCNNIRAELGVKKRLIKVANNKGEQRVIDLSHSQGDWLRTNFDYQARRVVAVLDDVNYALGRQLQTTLAAHYRDYTKPVRQLAFSVSIDRWTEVLREENLMIDSALHTAQVDTEELTVTFQKTCLPVTHTIRIRVPRGTSEEKLRAYIAFRFGGSIVCYKK